jgi:hypothetical protein
MLAVVGNLPQRERAKQWVLQWPGMVVLVVTAIYWTKGEEEVEEKE